MRAKQGEKSGKGAALVQDNSDALSYAAEKIAFDALLYATEKIAFDALSYAAEKIALPHLCVTKVGLQSSCLSV